MRKFDLIAGGLVLVLGGLLAGVLLTGGGGAAVAQEAPSTTAPPPDRSDSFDEFSFSFVPFGQELAEVLGLDIDVVRDRIAGGATLDDLAAEQDVDLTDVLDSVTDGLATRLAEAVETGEVDTTRADAFLNSIQTMIERVLGADLPDFETHFEFFGDGSFFEDFDFDAAPFGLFRDEGFSHGFPLGPDDDLPFHSDGPFRLLPRLPGSGVFGLHAVEEMAEVLGIGERELFERVAAGATLGEIADEEGADRTELVAVVTAPVRDWLEEATDDGFVTADQAREIEEGADALAEALIDKPLDELALGFGPSIFRFDFEER